MSYTAQGFTHGFLLALNRCVATTFSGAPKKAWPGEGNSPAPEVILRAPKILAKEKYLAIPTFIRRGKTLGL